MIKISYYYRRIVEKYRVNNSRKTVDLSDITLLSQNCIGGVMYHDCEAKFLSPMVNLYMMPSDFLKFVNNFEYYLSEAPVVCDGEKYPIGTFSAGLKINFMHYDSKEEALEKWESRKKRINKNKIFVICIERDGFSQKNYEEFRKLKFPKVLFTKDENRKNDEDCIYLRKYKNEIEVPDIILYRMMYYKNLLPKAVKKAFD